MNSIIKQILDRPQNKYHSLLISEEKIRLNQLLLAHEIIKDFSQLFVIVFHGNCLRLYLPKKYEQNLKFYSQRDSEICKSKRLYDVDGIYGSSLDEHMSKKLPNNYCYFNISPKKFNLKQIYKILAMLFKNSDLDFRTVITITGKYGERGYSFTSDNFDEFQFHLTDQYFPCHIKTKNCTDISQRLRLQGKYTDNPKLTLWTSNELKDILVNFFIPFMKKIEAQIMECNNWSEIKDLIESIIVEQENINFENMKYIDARKKNKNWHKHKHYEAKYNGFRLIQIDSMTEEEIQQWCCESGLPKYTNCVNEIKNDLSKEAFIEKYGILKALVPQKIKKEELEKKKGENKEYKFKILTPTTEKMDRKKGINDYIKNNKPYYHGRETKPMTITIIDYTKIYENIDYFHFVGLSNNKILPKPTEDIKKNPYHEDVNGNIKYCVLIAKYIQTNIQEYSNEDSDNFIADIADALPEQYYWKTPDGWLFLHDDSKTKKNIMSIDISEPKIKTITILKEPLINQKYSKIKEFIDECFESTKTKLRIGINDIMVEYKKWCEKNTYNQNSRSEVKNALNNYGYREEKSKGIDLNGKSGKRGFNIKLKII